jgi:hypothetical protein
MNADNYVKTHPQRSCSTNQRKQKSSKTSPFLVNGDKYLEELRLIEAQLHGGCIEMMKIVHNFRLNLVGKNIRGVKLKRRVRRPNSDSKTKVKPV